MGTYGLLAAITTADSARGNQLSNSTPGIPAVGTYYFHKSHINSTTLQTDANGALATTV
jgi:hypothetical protein